MESLIKMDLHCHLDGSLAPSAMERHLKRPLHPDEISVDISCRSLTEYLAKFDLPLQCLQTKEQLKEEACSFLEQVSLEHMDYMEVRFAPLSCMQKSLSCADVLDSVLAGLEEGKQRTGIDFRVITCAMRHLSPEQNMEMLNTAEQYLDRGVCAIDLAGDESRYPNTLFRELFEEARRKHIPFVIHSGETGNVENVRTAVDYGARRIGHGLALIQDPDLMQEVARKKIGVEMCPTSNLQTKAVQSLAEYPLKAFMDAGILVTVNTDNRTVSRTTLEHEFQVIRELYHDEGLIEQLMKNSKECAFI